MKKQYATDKEAFGIKKKSAKKKERKNEKQNVT